MVSMTPLCPDRLGTDVGPSYRDVGPSYVFSSPLSSSFFDFAQDSGGNVQADQGTPYQQREFQTPPAYTTYQTSFMESIFGGILHQYEGEQPIFDTSAIPYMGYSLPGGHGVTAAAEHQTSSPPVGVISSTLSCSSAPYKPSEPKGPACYIR
ncbi:hypothetical protein F511_10514 [Dorcoceras hygrometricum]|uniref:Uncharacterized protein n=1 Tax=Dorcoceras hygrometricum TaxID=472368 RepID=A0A2Z7AKA3_9LAMI|nr:hypothetical protein F511_10514 [Dorcoceras hygrometricum]